MSILIAKDEPYNLYDDTEGVAFGPTFEGPDHAEHFLRWLGEDDVRLRLGGAMGNWRWIRWDRWKDLYNEWFTENVDGDSGQLFDAYFDYKPHHRVEAILLTGEKVKGEILRREEDGWRVKLDHRPDGHFSEFLTVPGDRLRLISRVSVG